MRPGGSLMRISCLVPLLLIVPCGCASTKPTKPHVPVPAHLSPSSQNETNSIRKVSYEEPLPNPRSVAETTVPSDSLVEGGELSIEALVGEVLERNPTLAQMTATWNAARARYPQVTSLDDPMFGSIVAPAGLGTTGDASNGYRFEMSQRLPWRGKLALRGQTAQAQALAAANDVDAVRLQLIESTKIAFYDYYLVARAVEVNEENLRLLRTFRENAEARYKFGVDENKAPQQDILQADVEIGRQRKRGLTLERLRLVAIARINTLLNRDPDTPLPPPPQKIDILDELPDASQLRTAALRRRPDLAALSNRIRAEEAALALAYKEYYPDFDVMAAYDAFWTEPGLRPQVAMKMNLPVRLARRRAAVWEAKAKIAERRAELDQQVNQMNYEINRAYAEVNENKQAGRLYERTVVPAAELNVKAAQAAYQTGKIPFLTLVEAERAVIALKDEYYEFIAEYYRQLASLERAAGGSLALADDNTPPAHPGSRHDVTHSPR
jgi:cobalt-zinc-cadmium efflux system outer membrane protein